MIDMPSSREFITGWVVQNVRTTDEGEVDRLADNCRAAAAKRGVELDGDDRRLRQLILDEISAYRDNTLERALSRDD